ncbi:MAG: EAL domain-containing protein [Treponema sp.]|nr:EAL domain-containing protein [Treponema sp.]
MKKDDFASESKNNIDKTLERLYNMGQPPKFVFAVIILLYVLANFIVISFSGKVGAVNILGNAIPYFIFTGVFSSVANMCIIFLVVFFKKIGYVTAVVILLSQFPVLFMRLFVEHSYAAIPGFFSNSFTLVAVTIIYLGNRTLRKYQERVRHEAVTDSLTGLPNRFACKEIIEDFAKHDLPFAVVSVDLNNFKGINDTMGHEVGNKVLVEVASRWKRLADSGKNPTVDFVTRFSGDEFTFLIRNYKSGAELLESIGSYKAELEKTVTIDDCDYFLTACFGYAEFPSDADKGTNLLSCAGAAMHRLKKQNGSNGILHFLPDMLKIEQTLETERKIRGALDNGGIYLNLQPQYGMDHTLRGFEALARMKDSDGSPVSPAEFIPVAEKTGLIDRVDISVFRQVADFLSSVLAKKESDIIISFNISVRHLMKNNFVEEIKEILKTSGVPARNLELEITESVMIDSVDQALKRLKEIKDMGIKIAIDDFGTGYSSLSYLNKLPADLLKIDKAFIDPINSSEAAKQYVATIVNIGHVMNLEVISEGVESNEQLETLASIGCDFIQGYLWGRPVPLEEAAKMV